MKISYIKNISIVVLILLTLVQTGELWFGGTPNHNSFYSFLFAGSRYDGTERLEKLKTPYRIVINQANERFFISHSDTADELLPPVDNAITQLFKKGEFIRASVTDWDTILQNKSIILEYSFEVPSGSFTKSYGQKSNLLQSRMEYFNNIILVPATIAGERMKVYFVNNINGTSHCYEYQLTKEDVNREIAQAIAGLGGAPADIISNPAYEPSAAIEYLSSKQSAFTQRFNKNVFLAQIGDDGYFYNKIIATNPYMVAGETNLRSAVSKKVDIFFDNPSAKLPYITGNVYTYSDAKVVVKYYSTGVLDYTNYTPVQSAVKGTFDSSYSAAIGFIEKDDTIINNYYLSSYKNEENTWTFYFDLSVNHFPIAFSQAITSKTGMEHAFEVTVKNNMVVKYRHYVRTYELSSDTARVKKDFLAAINSMLSLESGYDDGTIDSLDLVYYVDGFESCSLYWRMKIDDAAFMLSGY